MKLAIQVKNLGEDAFESLIKLQLPEGVSYINVFKVKSVSIVCIRFDISCMCYLLCT